VVATCDLVLDRGHRPRDAQAAGDLLTGGLRQLRQSFVQRAQCLVVVMESDGIDELALAVWLLARDEQAELRRPALGASADRFEQRLAGGGLVGDDQDADGLRHFSPPSLRW